MSKLSRFRSSQIASSSGAGLHVISPQKSAPKRKGRHALATTCLDRERKRQKLLEELARLTPSATNNQASDVATGAAVGPINNDSGTSLDFQSGLSDGVWDDIDNGKARKQEDTKTSSSTTSDQVKAKRLSPNDAAMALHSKWTILLPTLVDPLLSYVSRSICKPSSPVVKDLKGDCSRRNGQCSTKDTKVVCLYFDHFITIVVSCCDCEAVSQVLVRNGLFPTAPAQIRMAVSVDLLDFYSALFERSCDAVNAMAAALNSFYGLRGYHLMNGKEERFKEPFRRGLGYASQWLDVLRVMIEDRVDSVLDQADSFLQARRDVSSNEPKSPSLFCSPVNPTQFESHHSTSHIGEAPTSSTDITHNQSPSQPPLMGLPFVPNLVDVAASSSPPSSLDSNVSSTSTPSRPTVASRTECARKLRQLCPACFGGSKFGTSLEDGGDFQIATDGNFHHRHLVSGGESIPFYDAKHVIPKEFVDAVGDHISKVRKSRPKKRDPKVPDCAVDECEKSHQAADGDKKRGVNEGRYDDMGWMSLVCRHDIPLFFANIDTPGEQQKYAFALILWFFNLIPPNTTVTALYDVGCVAERSVQLFDILPNDILPRLQFVTTAMHAYRHQWSCQLAYNPRLCRGLGLTDGEGVERIWSRLQKLIPIVRTPSRARRIYLTDRQLSRYSRETRADLGDWIKRRLRRGVQEQGAKAQGIVVKSGIKESDLRAQWELQKTAQLSLRAHAPARVRKELDAILSLQGDVEMVDKAIATVESMLQPTAASSQSKILDSLRDSRRLLINNLEALYVSLNVFEEFPDLKGINLEFIHTLFMARDLKINIRKRAVGSFFEWDRLDQATGGRNQALGTKLHQQTRKAIAKWTPALAAAIKKFNRYCVKLADLHEPSWNIPLPLPLPTKLSDLRNDSTLMEDVWVTPSETKPQPWLTDPDVRAGIRALLKLDRCTEEQRRLGKEADNLCAWFGREIAAVELAICTPQCAPITVQLAQHRDELLHLKSRWMTPLASAVRFDHHIRLASRDAVNLTGQGVAAPLKWIVLTTEIDGLSEACQAQPNGLPLEVDDERDDADEFDGNEKLSLDEDASEIIVADILQADDENELPETSEIQYSEDVMKFYPGQLRLSEDSKLAELIQKKLVITSGGKRYSRRHFGPFAFDEKDLQVFDAPDALLNDICLNGLAAMLQDLFVRDPENGFLAARCAIFSTYDLNRIRYNASDADLWRNTHRIEFWSKDIWIIPIHRRSQCHWVLAVIYLQCGEVHLFDSLALTSSWRADLKDISLLILRLVELARRSEHPINVPTEGWAAKTVTIHPMQSNDYDCGLWVLAWIAAILRGYGTTAGNLSESSMPTWRSFLGDLIRAKAPPL